MKKLFGVALASVLVSALSVAAGSPARAAGPTVTVQDMAFGPSATSTALGGSVTWSFQDSVAHTSTSDQGFWDSGTKVSGSTYVRTFSSAGTFAYHCSIHTMMRGKVSVAVAVKGHKITWATAKTAGLTYDVQTKLGSGKWVSLATGTTTSSAKLTTKGKYQVRARTDKGSSRSGWSPTVAVSIS